MTDEIKEILEWLNDKDYYIEDFGYKFKRLSLEENEALLDYITNLQEEKEIYKKGKDTLMNSLFITRNKYNNDKARYIRKAKNYRTRIYKAIKLLKDIKYDLDIEPWSIYQVKGNILFDLLNTLQGKSDE